MCTGVTVYTDTRIPVASDHVSTCTLHVWPLCTEFLSTAREPKQIERFFKGVAPVKPDHVLGLKEAVKQLPIVSYAEGTVPCLSQPVIVVG